MANMKCYTANTLLAAIPTFMRVLIEKKEKHISLLCHEMEHGHLLILIWSSSDVAFALEALTVPLNFLSANYYFLECFAVLY